MHFALTFDDQSDLPKAAEGSAHFCCFEDKPNRENRFTAIYFTPLVATCYDDIISTYSSENSSVLNPTQVMSLGGHGGDEA